MPIEVLGKKKIRVSMYGAPRLERTVVAIVKPFGWDLVKKATHIRIRGRILQITREDRRVQTTHFLKAHEEVSVELLKVDWIPFVFCIAVATRDKRLGTRHLEAHCSSQFFDLPGVREKIARPVGEEGEEYRGLAPALTWELIKEAKYTELFTEASAIQGIEWGEPVEKPFIPIVRKIVQIRLRLFDYNYPSKRPNIVPLTKFLVDYPTDVEATPDVRALSTITIERRDNWWDISRKRLFKLKKINFISYITRKGRIKKIEE